jgi:hypothetical protein
MLCEFTVYAITGAAKARKFLSTGSINPAPGSLKINWESYLALCWSLSLKVTSCLMSAPFGNLKEQVANGTHLEQRQLRSVTRTTMRHEPLEAPLPQPTPRWVTSLQRGSKGTKICIQRLAAKPTILWTQMTIITHAIQATRTHDLQSDESHAQRLSWLRLFTFNGPALLYRF